MESGRWHEGGNNVSGNILSVTVGHFVKVCVYFRSALVTASSLMLLPHLKKHTKNFHAVNRKVAL